MTSLPSRPTRQSLFAGLAHTFPRALTRAKRHWSLTHED